MKVFRKILKVMGITIGIFAGLICILAIYNQIALKAETRAGFLFCCISFPIENEIKKAQNNVLYHSFAYKTLKNLAEKNGGKIETSLSDNRLAITTGWVINNFS